MDPSPVLRAMGLSPEASHGSIRFGLSRDTTEIVHATDYRTMLVEAMKTETHAAKSYKEFLDLDGIDPELYDAVEQIYFQEERSVEVLNQLIDS